MVTSVAVETPGDPDDLHRTAGLTAEPGALDHLGRDHGAIGARVHDQRERDAVEAGLGR